jgi:hypothetical protein
VATNAVLAFRHGDNANQAGLYAEPPGSYAPRNKPMFALRPAEVDAIAYPEKWQPLSYLNAAHELKAPSFIASHWGVEKPFAMASGSAFRPGPPQSEFAQGFLDQTRHVVDIQAALTVEQKVIAEYWADGPNSELPPRPLDRVRGFRGRARPTAALGHGEDALRAGQRHARRQHCHLGLQAPLRLRAAGHDRPPPLPRQAHPCLGRAGARHAGDRRRGLAPLPVRRLPDAALAEYTSGHSAFSMAAAEVLKRYTGSDRFGFHYLQTHALKADPTEPVVGVVLSWATFSAAAREAGESRLYGGIHFYEGNVVGLEIGRKCGAAAYAKAQALWTGV